MDAFLDRMNSNTKLSGIGSNIIRSGSYANIGNIENPRQRNTPNL
jgi:hypothetical protein